MRKKRTGLIVFFIGISLVLFLYFASVLYFRDHMFPKTYVNGNDCSYMTEEEATKLIQQDLENYTLKFLDRDGYIIFEIEPDEIDLSMNLEEQMKKIKKDGTSFLWFLSFFEKESHEISYLLEYDTNKLKKVLKGSVLFDQEEVKESKDATISEYKKGIGFEILPEEIGNEIHFDTLFKETSQALTHMEKRLNLADSGCYIEPRYKESDEEIIRLCERMNDLTKLEIVYDWNGFREVVNGELIKDWLFVENGTVYLDEEKVQNYVEETADKHDTYGRKGTFLTTLGVELTLPRGAYGWKVDRDAETKELMSLILAGENVKREPIYAARAYHKGEDDIGNSYVEADMTNQHLYLYMNGEIVLETDFVSGDIPKGNTTPPGIFGITYKRTDAILRGADYETPVCYWMPFNGNVGMHDSTWRTEYGGDIYLRDGSHGCLNLPLDQAALIYNYMEKGFPVICYYY